MQWFQTIMNENVHCKRLEDSVGFSLLFWYSYLNNIILSNIFICKC